MWTAWHFAGIRSQESFDILCHCAVTVNLVSKKCSWKSGKRKFCVIFADWDRPKDTIRMENKWNIVSLKKAENWRKWKLKIVEPKIYKIFRTFTSSSGVDNLIKWEGFPFLGSWLHQTTVIKFYSYNNRSKNRCSQIKEYIVFIF